MSSCSNLEIDPNGDVELIIKSGDTHEQLDRHATLAEPALQKKVVSWSHLCIRVSSKHLSLVSRVFQAMLAGKFGEGQQLQATGSVKIELHNDHPVALYILLLIVHCQNRSVPHKIAVDTLVAVTILVDKYDVHEAVERYTNDWYHDALGQVGSNFEHCREADFVVWIGLTWVLNKPLDFQRITEAAIQRSQVAHLTTTNFPVPSTILGKPLRTMRYRPFFSLPRYLSSDLRL